MLNVNVDIVVCCGECGQGLCERSEARVDNHGQHIIRVSPCTYCLQKARKEGDDKGYDRGLKHGREEVDGT